MKKVLLLMSLACMVYLYVFYTFKDKKQIENTDKVEYINFKVDDTYIKKDYFYDEKDPFDVEKCDTIKIIDIKNGYILFQNQRGYEYSYSVEMLSRAIKNKIK